jgi:hypothetical protein
MECTWLLKITWMKGGKLPLSSMDEKAGWYSQYGWRK